MARHLSAFVFTSLDGYFAGPGGDISWHHHDAEGARFSERQLSGGATLVFGRKTYALMSRFWPTPMAAQAFPRVAEGMNATPKLVCSRTLKKVTWQNTLLLAGDAATSLRRLKKTKGPDLTILGSGSLVRLCIEHGLLDELQLLVDPVLLGAGQRLFGPLDAPRGVELVDSRRFKSGAVLSTYQFADTP